MSDTDDRPTLTQFTDPMCTWCWGAEPVVRHLRVAYGDRIRIEYVMGGLVEDFEAFHDPHNDISSPAEVGPHWEAAAQRHGMPVDTTLFDEDPPRSTYPASIAFAAARSQDRERAHRFLRLLREAVAARGRNPNRRAVQRDLADAAGLDPDRLVAAIEDGRAREAFEADLDRTQAAGVRAFPTYEVSGPEGERLAGGFQAFEALADLLETVAPGLDRTDAPPVREFVAEYGPVATREVAEVYGLDAGTARQTLESLTAEYDLTVEQCGTGRFWNVGGAA